MARFREILLFVARATMGSSVRGEECLGRLAPDVNVDIVFVELVDLGSTCQFYISKNKYSTLMQHTNLETFVCHIFGV